MKYILLFFFISHMVFCSRKPSIVVTDNQKNDRLITEETQVVEKDDSLLLPPPFDENYNKCFSFENGYSSYLYTDTISNRTKQGNFFKQRSISDSTYIWSCGRGRIEKMIDTLSCSKGKTIHLDWETDEFIGLTKGCGTYCWSNIIVPIKTDKPVFRLSYSAIDLDRMNAVSIVRDHFSIINLRTQKEIKFPIENIECVNGFPLFSIRELKLENTKLSFSIKCKDASIFSQEVEVGLIDLLD